MFIKTYNMHSRLLSEHQAYIWRVLFRAKFDTVQRQLVGERGREGASLVIGVESLGEAWMF